MDGCIDVDNFAGGGGASLGIEQVTGRHVDVGINRVRIPRFLPALGP